MQDSKHRAAISELEWIIRNNRTTALRCERYGDPQHEIDYYYERNERLQATIDFLKEHSK